MSCENHTLTVYYNGIPFKEDRHDKACQGESHLYTTSTTLLSPVTYTWVLDNVLVGTGSTYNYTFDDKKHGLRVTATSIKSQCSIGIKILPEGRKCQPECPIKCLSESVNIPSGIFTGLIDYNDVFYPVPTGHYFECNKFSKGNSDSIKAIISLIKKSAPCNMDRLQVSLLESQGIGKCLRLNIKNSPIKFRYLQLGESQYTFETNNC